MRALIICLCLAVLPAVCMAQSAEPYDTLPGTSWVLVEWDGAPSTIKPRANLVFGQGNTISGWAACNRFEGTYEIAEGRIALVAGGWTRTACGEEAVRDGLYADDLRRVVQLVHNGDGTLIAHADDGAVLFRFRRATPAETN